MNQPQEKPEGQSPQAVPWSNRTVDRQSASFYQAGSREGDLRRPRPGLRKGPQGTVHDPFGAQAEAPGPPRQPAQRHEARGSVSCL